MAGGVDRALSRWRCCRCRWCWRRAPIAAGGVVAAGGVGESALKPLAVLPAPVVLAEECTDAAGGVGVAGGVGEERPRAAGGVVVAGGVGIERIEPLAVLPVPVLVAL